MELLLVGVVGQVVALRLLAFQLARSPDDPPLLRRAARTPLSVERRHRRHRWLLRVAVAAFAVATVVAVAGVVTLFRT
jgi:hypothetical protein